MNYARRLEWLQDTMLKNNLDALVYGTGANFQYYTGLVLKWIRDMEPEVPCCILVVTPDQRPQVIVDIAHSGLTTTAPVDIHVVHDRCGVLKHLEKQLTGRRIGLSHAAQGYLSELVSQVVPGVTCIDAEIMGEERRYCKDAEEVAQLRKLANLTDKVMAQVVDHIRPGITQIELQTLLVQVGTSLGAETFSFPATAGFVKSGSLPTDDPFVYPEAKGLVAGSSIAFDFGFIQNGYCSDFGRSFYCGSAPDEIAGAYKALQDGQTYLINQMKPGTIKLGQLFGMLEAFLDERGYGDRLRARLPHGGLGHQIGVDLHENPRVHRGNGFILKPGMVMCLEPKLWLPGEYYLRVEDMVLVTETGAESLTNFDRDLFELPVV